MTFAYQHHFPIHNILIFKRTYLGLKSHELTHEYQESSSINGMTHKPQDNSLSLNIFESCILLMYQGMNSFLSMQLHLQFMQVMSDFIINKIHAYFPYYTRSSRT